jgi:hypothetical protein
VVKSCDYAGHSFATSATAQSSSIRMNNSKLGVSMWKSPFLFVRFAISVPFTKKEEVREKFEDDASG